MNSKEFSLTIEGVVKEKKISHMDAVVWYCDENGLDTGQVGSLISKSLKEEQKKYSIKIGGGDTVYSKIPSFSVTVIGFSKKIVYRNNAKYRDDIYVTGDLGDSYLGLKLIENK